MREEVVGTEFIILIQREGVVAADCEIRDGRTNDVGHGLRSKINTKNNYTYNEKNKTNNKESDSFFFSYFKISMRWKFIRHMGKLSVHGFNNLI